MVEPTHLKQIWGIKLDHFPKVRVETKKYLSCHHLEKKVTPEIGSNLKLVAACPKLLVRTLEKLVSNKASVGLLIVLMDIFLHHAKRRISESEYPIFYMDFHMFSGWSWISKPSTVVQKSFKPVDIIWAIYSKSTYLKAILEGNSLTFHHHLR